MGGIVKSKGRKGKKTNIEGHVEAQKGKVILSFASTSDAEPHAGP